MQPHEVHIPKEKEPKQEKYALLSVFNKEGVTDFAQVLDDLGYRIISTGGTAKALEKAEISVVPIQEITGNPESFDGRMKTISFQVESGILFDRENSQHQKEAEELGVKPIDIVVCNLYPFEQTVGKADATQEDIIESIDVGGPTMIRAAAKNLKNVLVIVDPSDYQRIAAALKSGKISDELRNELAAKAFYHLSFYDSQIGRYFDHERFPQELTIPGRESLALRYGENPHQTARVYLEPNSNSPLGQLQRYAGRELSYVNFTDIAAGIESVRMFDEPAAVVIKHNTPCGIAVGDSSETALARAIFADPESAFGGVVITNSPIDSKAAEKLAQFKERDGVQMDIVAAPSITEEAQEFIHSLRKSTGIYTFGEIPQKRSSRTHLRFFDGGYILQDWDDDIEKGFEQWEIVSDSKPTKKQLKQMEYAWKFMSRIRSNAVIVVHKDLPMTCGIGTGQTSRVRSTKIALEQAGEEVKGSILASDSFFPFGDSVELAAKYGIGAIVQQGGSVNDQASIDAANKAKIPMVFTKRRAFSH